MKGEYKECFIESVKILYETLEKRKIFGGFEKKQYLCRLEMFVRTKCGRFML